MMSAIRWGFVAALCATAALWLIIDGSRVPYTTACFQPNREARSMCLTQTWANTVYNNLASLQNADAQFLEDNEEQIVGDYTQAFMSGMLPDQNFTPLVLRHMIKDLIIAKRGLPI